VSQSKFDEFTQFGHSLSPAERDTEKESRGREAHRHRHARSHARTAQTVSACGDGRKQWGGGWGGSHRDMVESKLTV